MFPFGEAPNSNDVILMVIDLWSNLLIFFFVFVLMQHHALWLLPPVETWPLVKVGKSSLLTITQLEAPWWFLEVGVVIYLLVFIFTEVK